MCKVRSVILEDKVSLVQLVKTMLGDENLEETAKLVV